MATFTGTPRQRFRRPNPDDPASRASAAASRGRLLAECMLRGVRIAVWLALLGGGGGAAFEAGAATSPPTAGLAVWLRADAGVTTTSGKVSTWADQSGSGRNATQGTAAARPTFVANALNGKPVVSFNGTNTYLSLSYAVNGLTGMTIVLVTNNTASQTGGQWGNENAALFWPQSASWGELHLSPFQTSVRFRFGTGQTSNLPSYTRPASLGSAYSRTIASRAAHSLVNGGAEYGKLGTIKNCQSTATIGRGGSSTVKYFKGNIAEIMVYNRALTAAELTTVDTYLVEKYFPVAGPPPAPTGLVAAAGDQQVTLSWNAAAGATGYAVKRSTTSGSAYEDAASGLSGTSYTDTGLTNDTTYYYVTTASNTQGTSGHSNEVFAVPTAAPPGVAITRSGTVFLLDGQPFTMWGMRVASASQTPALTNQLIANLDAYKANGLNTITVFYQGSSGGFTDPFTANGLGMDPGHKARMEQIVAAARARGMVVIVGILYQRAVWNLNSATSVHNAMKTAANFMLPYRNVIINVANESNSGQYSDTNGIYNVNLPANIGALCADVHSIDPARLCGGGGFNDSHNVGVGLNANIDALLFSTDNVTPTSTTKYNSFVSQGVNNKPIVNVELFGGYTLNWPTPGVFDATAKGYYQNEVAAKLSRPALSIFFFSEPWSQRAPIHYELGGQGTAADPGIKWYWDYVQQQSAVSTLGALPAAWRRQAQTNQPQRAARWRAIDAQRPSGRPDAGPPRARLVTPGGPARGRREDRAACARRNDRGPHDRLSQRTGCAGPPPRDWRIAAHRDPREHGSAAPLGARGRRPGPAYAGLVRARGRAAREQHDDLRPRVADGCGS